MYFSTQLKWHERAWFAVSVLLNVISLSAFVDELMGWRSWVSAALAWYRELIAAILASSGLIPHFTPPVLISTISQLLVFMGGVFASANFYALRTEGQTVFQRIYDTSCRAERFAWVCAALKTALFYFLGPALLPFVLWKALVRRAPTQRILGFTFRPALVAAYYFSLVATIVAGLAAASFAYTQYQRQTKRGLEVALWHVDRLRS
jgi:hypothetical protein